MVRLYDYLASGNGYKVRLLLHQLGIPFERIQMDVDKAETRTPAFLAKNPNGRIPVLETERGEFLPESNAILFYLADGTPYLPADRWLRAQVLQWMCFEQYSHEPNVATVRYWVTHHVPHLAQVLEQKRKLGADALGVMEGHLRTRTFFVGERYTIADIALYAYTHVAGEGGFDLAPHLAVLAWLGRVRAQPGHIPITQG